MSTTNQLRKTAYNIELARGVVPLAPESEGRLERFRLTKAPYIGVEEIRLSAWVEGRPVPKALTLSEAQFLEMLGSAISAGVFSKDFLDGLGGLLKSAAE